MPELAALLASADLRQRALLVLLASVLALVLLALAFGAYAVLVRLRSEARETHWRRLTDLWDPLVLAALADPDRAGAVHRAVGRADRLRFVRFVLEYHRRISGEEARTLTALAQPYLPLVAARVGSPRPEVRARAVQTLGTLGMPEHAAQVVTALGDPSPLVAMVAARALCDPRHPEYGAAVLRKVGRFHGWSRGFLASMLAGVGQEMAPHLRSVLDDAEQPQEARAVAADALRLLSDLEAAEPAARAAEASGSSVDLAAAALRLLGTVGGPGQAPAARAGARSPQEPLRVAAMGALGTLGSREDVPRLLEGLDDPSPWVAIRAARSLVALGAARELERVRASAHPRAALAAQVLLEQQGPS